MTATTTMHDAPNARPPDADFPQLMGHLRARLHRYCARMTGSMLDGEDIVQETLIKASASYSEATVQHVESWLFRIAHNTAMDFLRRRNREQAVFDQRQEDEARDAFADVNAQADSRVVATAALRTFMGLAPAQRSAVILCDVLGYEANEAARAMESTVPAVKASLHRGRARLHELANRPADAVQPVLSASDRALLTAYADRFNARDWDGLRDLLSPDMQVDLVARRKPFHAGRGEYYVNYAKTQGLRMVPAQVEGRPALWVDALAEGEGASGYFVVAAIEGGRITALRDFRYARYAGEGAVPERIS